MRRLFLITLIVVISFFIAYHVYHIGRAIIICCADDEPSAINNAALKQQSDDEERPVESFIPKTSEDILPAPSVPSTPIPSALPSFTSTPELNEESDAPQSFFMAVASNSPEAQKETLRGIHHLLCFWDEAARLSFAKALKLDPNCCMAHWGMIMSSISPTDEANSMKEESLNNLKSIEDISLLPIIEQDYLAALYAQLKVGPMAAAQVLKEQSNVRRADKLNTLLRSLLGRNGHLANGSPKTEQIHCIETLDQFLEREPNNHAANFIRALIEESSIYVSHGTLVAARKAAELAPNHPPSLQLFGSYLFRTGEYAEAAKTFKQTAQLYKAWQEKHKLTLADNPSYIKALLSLATAQWCSGEKNLAKSTIKELFALPIEHTRQQSLSTLLQYWEVRTLPLRLLLSGNRPLKSKEIAQAIKEARHYISDKEAGLSNIQLLVLINFAYNQIAFDNKNFSDIKKTTENAKKLSVKLNEDAMTCDQAGAMSFWLRTREISDLSILEGMALQNLGFSELWYDKAADNSLAPSLLLPPILPYPAELRRAQYHLKLKEYTETIKACEQGLLRYPKLPALLHILEQAKKLQSTLKG